MSFHRRTKKATNGRRFLPYDRGRPHLIATTAAITPTTPYQDESTVEDAETTPALTAVNNFQQTLQYIAQLNDYTSIAARRLFQAAIDEFGTDRKNRQLFIQAVLTRMLGNAPPRPGQVESVRRIVFKEGDTLLVASTGYGKSLVLHAVSIIYGGVTLQIVPLTALGEEQARSIATFKGTRPIMISANTHREVWLFLVFYYKYINAVVIGLRCFRESPLRTVAACLELKEERKEGKAGELRGMGAVVFITWLC
jgi:hypothetical protein